MSVIKVIEIIGTSNKSFEEAIKEGIKRASQTIRNITGAEIVSQNLVINKGKIIEYRVVMKIAFVVE